MKTTINKITKYDLEKTICNNYLELRNVPKKQVRNELPLIGIKFNTNQRSKGSFNNELENMVGIGKSNIDIL